MDIRPFDDSLKDTGLYPLLSVGVKILQVNVLLRCNQACRHCHVVAGPDRQEVMGRPVMEACLALLRESSIETVDITGGAPEMSQGYTWFVERLTGLGLHVKTRTNLTILLVDGFTALPEFFASNKVEIIASFPYYLEGTADRQRGKGVFAASIEALKRLNGIGYGMEGTGLELNLVYNPAGAFLPPSQKAIERDFRRELLRRYGICFTNLFTITNMPIGRFKDFLVTSGNYTTYMERLAASYNPTAAANVMCRETLSIGWDGSIFDCDFNQMLGLKSDHGAPDHISNYDLKKFDRRQIVTGLHCYGCTAGAGSSCGGAVVNDD